jgi:uncharacterized membrane protein
MKKDPKSKSSHPAIEAKKAAVIGKKQPHRFTLFLFLLAIIAIGAGAAVYFISSHTSATVPDVSAAAPQSTDTIKVQYPVGMFEDGKARHFEHQTGNITVRYFILKSTDGVIRAAFDACDVCWPAGKGYYQEGETMVCRNCGRRFASIRINEVKGGCNPAPLNRTLTDGHVVIAIDDILKGTSYFDFSGKA